MGVRKVQWPELPYKCTGTFTKATKKNVPYSNVLLYQKVKDSQQDSKMFKRIVKFIW